MKNLETALWQKPLFGFEKEYLKSEMAREVIFFTKLKVFLTMNRVGSILSFIINDKYVQMIKMFTKLTFDAQTVLSIMTAMIFLTGVLRSCKISIN